MNRENPSMMKKLNVITETGLDHEDFEERFITERA